MGVKPWNKDPYAPASKTESPRPSSDREDSVILIGRTVKVELCLRKLCQSLCDNSWDTEEII